MKSKVRAVVPIWSQYIEVTQPTGDILLIKGDGYIPCPVFPASREDLQWLRQIDLTHKLRRYALRFLKKPHRDVEIDGPDGVYQFANATSDEKLIAFVQEFGPVKGEVIEEHPVGLDEPEVWELTVKETLRSLRREQKRFQRLVEIVRQVNRNAHADFASLNDLLTALAADTPVNVSDDWISAIGSLVRILTAKPSAKLLPVANQILCCSFNRHPLQLFPVADGVVELPRMHRNGIRDVLYFQLRLDYLAQRTIGTCLHCHGHFPVYRRGTPACGASCSRALRNQRYWQDKKESINARRRGEVNPGNQRAGKPKTSRANTFKKEEK